MNFLLLLSSNLIGNNIHHKKLISHNSPLFNPFSIPTNSSTIKQETMENKVILYGMWASPFVKRVEVVLKLKGIDFEYVEEDLQNKSPSLLKLNPIYKKVPVLVDGGKPVMESRIIVEYIDETWKEHGPQILPKDPFERARVRFWTDFIDRQIIATLMGINGLSGEARMAVLEQVKETTVMLEEGVKGMLPAGRSLVGGETLGLLDIVIWSLFGPYHIHREVTGHSFVDAETCPVIMSLVEAISEQPVAKASALPREKLVAFLRSLFDKV